MTKFYRGIAGRRPGKPRGAVIHNDAGSQNATVAFYKQWLNSNRAAENGFAHVYMSSDGRYQLEDYDNMAWHTANQIGNTWYVGWEVDQSMGDLGVFMRNEVAVLKDVAKFMLQYGLAPNRETVRLHKEFSSTTCPHRSWEIHGQLIDAVKDYFIQEIKKYMGRPDTDPQPDPAPGVTGYTVERWNKQQSVDVDVLNIRAAQTSNSGMIGTLKKGQTFNATRICRNGQNVAGYTTWFEVNGRGWVSGAYVTEIGGGSVSTGGSYTFNNATNVRDNPSLSAAVVAQYQPGQTVIYDRTVQADGYTWMGYVGGSGKRRWVAKTN